MIEKLKPCPFCGGKAELWEYRDLDEVSYYIGCTTCGAQTKYTDSEDLCIEAWNRRATDDEG